MGGMGYYFVVWVQQLSWVKQMKTLKNDVMYQPK